MLSFKPFSTISPAIVTFGTCFLRIFVHGCEMFCRLSLNIHNPVSDPLIDPTTTSYRDLGITKVVVVQVLMIGLILGPPGPCRG